MMHIKSYNVFQFELFINWASRKLEWCLPNTYFCTELQSEETSPNHITLYGIGNNGQFSDHEHIGEYPSQVQESLYLKVRLLDRMASCIQTGRFHNGRYKR